MDDIGMNFVIMMNTILNVISYKLEENNLDGKEIQIMQMLLFLFLIIIFYCCCYCLSHFYSFYDYLYYYLHY